VVVNDDLDRCVDEVLAAIERARASVPGASVRAGEHPPTRT
jgi:hypothetical protein